MKTKLECLRDILAGLSDQPVSEACREKHDDPDGAILPFFAGLRASQAQLFSSQIPEAKSDLAKESELRSIRHRFPYGAFLRAAMASAAVILIAVASWWLGMTQADRGSENLQVRSFSLVPASSSPLGPEHEELTVTPAGVYQMRKGQTLWLQVASSNSRFCTVVVLSTDSGDVYPLGDESIVVRGDAVTRLGPYSRPRDQARIFVVLAGTNLTSLVRSVIPADGAPVARWSEIEATVRNVLQSAGRSDAVLSSVTVQAVDSNRSEKN